MSKSKPLGEEPIDDFIEYHGTNILRELVLGDFGDYETTDGKKFDVGEREEARSHQRYINKKEESE